MKLKPSPLATVAALAVALSLGACKRDEPVTTTAPAPTPAAATVTAVDLGSAVDADGRVVAGTTTFATTDTITASVMTTTGTPTGRASGTLGARWTFEDGQVVNQESKTFEFTGPGVTNFQISKPDGWPVGRYRVEISLDGQVVQTRDFEVR